MAEDLVVSKVGGYYRYNRSRSNQSEILREQLKTAYGVNGCVIQPSGMSSIATTLHALILQHRNVVIWYGKELYTDTPTLVESLSQVYGTERVATAVYDFKLMTKAWATATIPQILLVEAVSNPNGHVFDLEEWKTLRRIANKLAILIVDNTWLTHVICNPFQIWQPNYVVVSLTKYYGAGQAIGGAILAQDNKSLHGMIAWTCTNGLHTSPHNCEIISGAIPSIEKRIRSSSQQTCNVLNKLSKNACVKLEHPIFQEQTETTALLWDVKEKKSQLVPSVFTLSCPFKGTKLELETLLKACKNIEYKTSFGASKSRINPWPVLENGICSFRVAVGYNEGEDEKVLGNLHVLIHQLVNL